MNHQYSKFKNKAIPYAKVGRRVFGSLFNAETFCSDHGLDVNSAIEYGEIPELKNEVQEIAKYQKSGSSGSSSSVGKALFFPTW